MKLPGDDTGQHVTMPRRTLAELITEELRRLDPDEVYGEVLATTYSSIDDTSTFADMFGGGVSSSASASGVAERNLNRLTVAVAVSWGLCAVGLGIVERFL